MKKEILLGFIIGIFQAPIYISISFQRTTWKTR